MKHFLFRRQVLNWEYLLSIPSLLVRLLVTVANDIPKIYRRLIVLDVGGDRRFHDCPRLGATGFFSFYVYMVDAPVGAVRMRYVWLAYKFKLQSKVSSSH